MRGHCRRMALLIVGFVREAQFDYLFLVYAHKATAVEFAGFHWVIPAMITMLTAAATINAPKQKAWNFS
jgi:hypothetical protein